MKTQKTENGISITITEGRTQGLKQVDSLRKRVALQWAAIVPTNRRQYNWNFAGYSEDRVLNATFRRLALETIRDTMRIAPLATFALTKHLQFNATLKFYNNTQNDNARNKLNDIVKNWHDDLDITGRYDFEGLQEIVETLRVTDGDVLIAYQGNGKVRIFESKEIISPTDAIPDGCHDVQGVRVSDDTGEVIGYNVKPGGINSNAKNYFVPAEISYLVAYRKYQDQYRGISPILTGVNQFIDCYEGVEYALKKAKIAQFVGIVARKEVRAAPENFDAEKQSMEKHFGGDILYAQMGLNDNLEFVTADSPGYAFQEFLDKVGAIAFASLDIPYAFYDTSKANYYGNKLAYELYVDTVQKKQREPKRAWKKMLNLTLAEKLADSAMMPKKLVKNNELITPEDIQGDFGYNASRYPLWQFFEDIKTAAKANELGFVSKEKICEPYGINWQDEIDTINKEKNQFEREADMKRETLTI